MPRAKDRTGEVDENKPVLYCVKCRTWREVTSRECVTITDSGKIWTCEGCRDGKVDAQAPMASSNPEANDSAVALGACVKIGIDGKCHHKGRHKRG